MHSLRFFFDPLSPYAYLAFEHLPDALQGLSYEVEYLPVLLAPLLKANGQKGPAEIETKRHWTFRQVAWQAHQLSLPLQVPEQHPFNPLALARLCWATAAPGRTPSRFAVEQVLRHVWRGEGADANAPARLTALRQQLQPQQEPDSDAVKAALRAATDLALALGCFGVPTIAFKGRLFWGFDALPMLAAAMRGEAWFDGPDWDAAAAPRAGVIRS
ncbi:MAG TPA: 2-hydroxychromene-2-carboxylate isomerase [Burkholderiaceae bacterium]